MTNRVVVWFSCGAASAVAAQLAVQRYGAARVVVVYCDMARDEHPDNVRFRRDIEQWLGIPVRVIASARYASVNDVFEQRRYMSGPKGALCTVEMKKIPRFAFQAADDLHVFGLSADEATRIQTFSANNPELSLAWLLLDAGITKAECFRRLAAAGIQLPALYALGYKNNNCIGCVKASSPKYWALVRRTFPDVFTRRAEQSRAIGCQLVLLRGQRIYLDELPADDFGWLPFDDDLTCGPECGSLSHKG